MEKVNALELRQSMGKIIAKLNRSGEPVLLEKGRKPVAVLITLSDFRERFVEKDASLERERLFAAIDDLAIESVDGTPGVEILRTLRGNG